MPWATTPVGRRIDALRVQQVTTIAAAMEASSSHHMGRAVPGQLPKQSGGAAGRSQA